MPGKRDDRHTVVLFASERIQNQMVALLGYPVVQMSDRESFFSTTRAGRSPVEKNTVWSLSAICTRYNPLGITAASEIWGDRAMNRAMNRASSVGMGPGRGVWAGVCTGGFIICLVMGESGARWCFAR